MIVSVEDFYFWLCFYLILGILEVKKMKGEKNLPCKERTVFIFKQDYNTYQCNIKLFNYLKYKFYGEIRISNAY